MTTTARRTAVVAAVLLVVGMTPALAGGPSQGVCTRNTGPGGDWPSFDGPDTSGHRNQVASKGLTTATVGNLRLRWSTAGSGLDTGQGTPVVSGSCLYVVGTDGYATAYDIKSGKVVWRRYPTPFYPKKKYAFAAAVADGRLYYSIGDGLQAQGLDADVVPVALDANTGATDYVAPRVRFDYPNNAGSSAVVYRGIQIVTVTGPDGDPNARPGYALLDAVTGRTLHAQTTIPEALLRKGYSGGGIWATPVVDPATGYAYVGTANPYSKFKQSKYDDAILKIDLNRSRRTFGQIVGVYSGTVDQIVPGANQQPACDIFGDSLGSAPDAYSLTCLQTDIDFGGSPGLARDSHGRTLVVEIQKSAELHAVYAATMKRAWKVNLGSPFPPATSGPLDSPAFDGKHVFMAASGTMFALNPDDGSIAWATPLADVGLSEVPEHPVQVSNGIVFYSVGAFVDAYNASTGQLLWVSDTTNNSGTAPCSVTQASGLAIAHDMVFKNCGNAIAAYALGG